MASRFHVILAVWMTVLSLVAPQSAVAAPQWYSTPTPDVERALISTTPHVVSWGAYSAGTRRMTGAIPLLERLLEWPPPAPERERTALVDAMLDALVQLDAAVPAPILRRYFDTRPVQTLLLLANAPDREPVLLALLSKATGLRWYAVANLLLRDGSPGLAIHLLSTMTLHLTIEVRDDDLDFGYGSGGGFWCGDGTGTNPPQFPPRAVYRITSSSGDGDLVLADGPHPVYYSRRLVYDTNYGFGECGRSGPDDSDRITYLRAIHGLSERSTPSAETNAFVRWSTPEMLIEKVEELRVGIERDYQSLMDALLVSGAIARDTAAELPPRIDIRLRDERVDRSIPLPSVSDIR